MKGGDRLWSTDKTKIRLLSTEVGELNSSPDNYKGYACDAQERIANGGIKSE